MSEARPDATRAGVAIALAAVIMICGAVLIRYDGNVRLHLQPRYPYEREAITFFLGRESRGGGVLR